MFKGLRVPPHFANPDLYPALSRPRARTGLPHGRRDALRVPAQSGNQHQVTKNVLFLQLRSELFYVKLAFLRYIGLIANMLAKVPQLAYVHSITVGEVLTRATKHIFVNYLQSLDSTNGKSDQIQCVLAPDLVEFVCNIW